MVYIQSGKKDPGPEDHFAEIVGAANQTEEAGVDKTARILLLGPVFLQVRSTFKKQTADGYNEADDGEGVSFATIHQAEGDGRGLQYIEQGSSNPDAELSAERNAVIGLYFALHAALVGGFSIAIEEIAGKPAAVDDEEGTLEDRPDGQSLREEKIQTKTNKSYGSAIAYGNEPDILVETYGACQKCQDQDDEKCLHEELHSATLCGYFNCFRFD